MTQKHTDIRHFAVKFGTTNVQQIDAILKTIREEKEVYISALKEKIEGMKKMPQTGSPDKYQQMLFENNMAYNLALQDILSLLDESETP